LTPLSETPTSKTSKRNLAAFGVMLVIFLFAIDATIVSTAMPTIVAKLGGLELYSWVFSIYMLTSALSTPLFGKLSDLYSRRRLMLIGIAIFVLGSTLCGAAQSMEALVLFRAVQGLGGGAIYALSFILVGVLYSPEQRAKMQGIISGIWGIASILGPLAGGIIVENWSWRWAFFVNLPITAVAIALIGVGLKEAGGERRAHNLDFAGTLTLLSALLLLFYALSHSAHSRQPLHAELIGIIALAIVFLIAFYFIERRAAEPIIPLDLFKLSLFKTSAVVATLAAMGVFGAVSYLPLYLQGISGLTASRAGMLLLFVSVTWTAGSLIAGIEIALENETDQVPDLLVKLVDEVDNPCLGVCFDIGHARLFSELDAPEWVRRMDHRLLHVHLHDNDGKGDCHWPLGRGTIDFEPFYAALPRHAPQAIISLEVEDKLKMEVKMTDLRKVAARFASKERSTGVSS